MKNDLTRVVFEEINESAPQTPLTYAWHKIENFNHSRKRSKSFTFIHLLRGMRLDPLGPSNFLSPLTKSWIYSGLLNGEGKKELRNFLRQLKKEKGKSDRTIKETIPSLSNQLWPFSFLIVVNT